MQHNDTRHNDTQHNDTQHNGIQHNDTQHLTLSIMTHIINGLFETLSINDAALQYESCYADCCYEVLMLWIRNVRLMWKGLTVPQHSA